MEKTIYIDETPVRLKSTAATPLRYKAQFRKDYFSELFKLSKLANKTPKSKDNENSENEELTLDLDSISFEDLNYLDFEIFYNFIWVLAKTADSTIPEPIEWLDTFDSMPIAEVFPMITDLLQASIQSKKKLTK
ncbi:MULTISPECIES: hypothetical protein [unclassified Enterococcus]|uniref:hypothetical protein n=1 Tax=unclassified Enterococcus TaxID=2608891 RepID=UPI00155429A9|nr:MULTISPECIES: hypothetical protein [unclassified Enterococcus]MBS7578458.1 hypothetical protein [Enterococcus sp. MMGLQ5-2]MBS7585677.1 hypothetical protein [Enterococcus sp. MMGLQ5-1]NPD13536.1 hypothetical protein [Enterococcus sp. MMGLQ5-1]NPD38290.1 hypothetical protein [Enterococcus sp. MMGLQ5-2]